MNRAILRAIFLLLLGLLGICVWWLPMQSVIAATFGMGFKMLVLIVVTVIVFLISPLFNGFLTASLLLFLGSIFYTFWHSFNADKGVFTLGFPYTFYVQSRSIEDTLSHSSRLETYILDFLIYFVVVVICYRIYQVLKKAKN